MLRASPTDNPFGSVGPAWQSRRTMRQLPVPDPGIPDTRSPWRFFGWLVRAQLRTVLAGACYGIVWMLSQAVAPLLVGRALDQGVADKDMAARATWGGALAGLGRSHASAARLRKAAAGILRHRIQVLNGLPASYRCNQLAAGAVARLFFFQAEDGIRDY